jgi:putative heme-binding domain-containing protein
MIESLVDQVAARGDKPAIGVIATALSQENFPNDLRANLLGVLHTHERLWTFRLDETIENPATKSRLMEIGVRAKHKFTLESTTEGKLRELAIAGALLPTPEAMKLLQSLLLPSEPSELQLAALEALGSYREPEVADILIDAFKSLTPPLRDKAVTILLSRTDRIANLLDAIEAKRILPAQLSAAAKATLGRQKVPALAARIAKLFGDGSSSNRAEVIAKYQSALSMTGDAARGAKVYETMCMVCHRQVDRGNDVGPNLGTIKGWTPEQILTNVLDPNREVSPNFALYLIETIDGRTLSGLIANETAGNLTLKMADGSQQSVLRSEIKTLTSPGISLMPEGLEGAISPTQMADLISYLRE